jgi:hypothetical protein
MTRFYFNDKAKLTATLQLLAEALTKFNARNFDADQVLLSALNACIIMYKDLGKTDRETQFLALKAEWVTANRGINPLTFEKVTIRRSDMTTGVSFRLLQRAEQLLNEDLAAAEQRIKEAADLIAQIIIAALQAGLLKAAPIEGIEDTAMAGKLWDSFAGDANIVLGQKRVQLLVHRYDALLIFSDLLQRL